MDVGTGTIIRNSEHAQDRGIYEVDGVRYVFCKFKGQFCFMVDRIHPDVHEAWRMGYREEIARAKAKELETISA